MMSLNEIGDLEVLGKSTKVFLNGVWVGVHSDPHVMVETLKEQRRCGHISSEVSIVRDIKEQELRINTGLF